MVIDIRYTHAPEMSKEQNDEMDKEIKAVSELSDSCLDIDCIECDKLIGIKEMSDGDYISICPKNDYESVLNKSDKEDEYEDFNEEMSKEELFSWGLVPPKLCKYDIEGYSFTYTERRIHDLEYVQRVINNAIDLINKNGGRECKNTVKELKIDMRGMNKSNEDRSWHIDNLDYIKDKYIIDEMMCLFMFKRLYQYNMYNMLFDDGINQVISDSFFELYGKILGTIPEDAPISYIHSIRLAAPSIFREKIAGLEDHLELSKKFIHISKKRIREIEKEIGIIEGYRLYICKIYTGHSPYSMMYIERLY